MKEIFENFNLHRYVNVTTDTVMSFKARGRPYVDITYCFEGELDYEYNGDKFVVHGGDAVLFLPHTMRLRHEGSVPTHYVSFNVILPEDFEIEASGHFKKCITSDTVYLIELFDRVWRSVGPRRMERCKGIFYHLYNELIDTVADAKNPHVDRMRKYVIDNLSGKITVADIAAEVHLVPQYACSLFKKHTGMTIVEFINRERIELAKRLMIVSDTSLYEIADSCGFSNYNYFSNTFRKITGTSPARYRKYH